MSTSRAEALHRPPQSRRSGPVIGAEWQRMRVARTGGRPDGTGDGQLLALFRAIAAGNVAEVAERLESSPGLATRPIEVGASRQGPDGYFLVAIRHHVYRGDTALHIAAAAHQGEVTEWLIARGADVRARNRRGAGPLHYAADGSPGAERWDPDAQVRVVAYLIEQGADPNALDNSGVAPLHRAVRTRCSSA